MTITQSILAPHTTSPFLPPPTPPSTSPPSPAPKPIPDPAHSLTLRSTQTFHVFGPRFSLPPSSIHQTYPPQGHSDANHVLPHIVFADPHLPWEVIGSPREGALVGDGSTRPRNSTPWLALLVFTESELLLPPEQLALLPPPPTGTQPYTQDRTTQAITLPLSAVLSFATAAGGATPIITPVRDDDPTDPIDATEKADMVFLTPDLFTALFSSYTSPSVSAPGSGRFVPADHIPDLTRYKYLAHVRNINTSAMSSTPLDADADADQGLFSVVVSHRTGPQSSQVDLPKPAIVHLVSLQGIEGNVRLPLAAGVKRVALVSLHSWNYTCLPPDSVGFVDAVRTLGRELAGMEGGVRGPDADLPAPPIPAATPTAVVSPSPASGTPAASNPAVTTAVAVAAGTGSIAAVVTTTTTPTTITATTATTTATTTTTAADSAMVTGGTTSIPALTIAPTTAPITAPATGAAGTEPAVTPSPSPAPAPTPPPPPVVIPGADALLRPPQTIIARALTSAPTPITTRLASRLTSGYSLVRYLTRSGDTTVAFFRGPLTPLPAPPQPLFWPATAAANFSSGLQILDPVCRVVDIAYASAWELGRTLAVADRVFAAAVGRVRRAVVVMGKAPARGKADVLGAMRGTVGALSGMVEALVQQGGTAVDPAKRWMPPVVVSPTVGVGVDRVALVAAGASAAMATIAAAGPPPAGVPAASGDSAETVLLPYNEINVPASNDWALILKWVVDKLYFYNIPAHYLITDPSHLPPESIRFFYVDDSWLDALIDGALSIGNTLERETDSVRLAMKKALNAYFDTPLDADAHPFRPQIPRYGFFLRSALVKAFPNMEVHAPYPRKGDPRVEVLRADRLSDEVLLCLFDRVPGDPDFTTIVLQQPPHQQRFAAGTGFETEGGVNKFSFEFLKMYTVNPQNDAGSALRTVNWLQTDPSCPFDYENNTLIFPRFADTCISVLTRYMNPPPPPPPALPGLQHFTDATATSAVVGLQLNDGIARLTVKVPLAPLERKAELQKVRKIPLPEVPPEQLPVVGAVTPVPAATTPPTTPPTHTFLSPAEMASTQPPGTAPTPIPPPPPSPVPVRAVAPAPATIITAGPPGGQHASQFQINAFVIGQKSKPLLVPLYPATPAAPPNLPIDIVFSFMPALTQISGLQISRINIFVPLGPGAKNLTAEYNGPGGKMLSNQRFNVDVRTENGSLNITLLPRSNSLLVPLQVNPDVSFVLNQVKLNGVEGDVRIDIREVYKSRRKDGNFDGSVGTGQLTIKKRLWSKL